MTNWCFSFQRFHLTVVCYWLNNRLSTRWYCRLYFFFIYRTDKEWSGCVMKCSGRRYSSNDKNAWLYCKQVERTKLANIKPYHSTLISVAKHMHLLSKRKKPNFEQCPGLKFTWFQCILNLKELKYNLIRFNLKTF